MLQIELIIRIRNQKSKTANLAVPKRHDATLADRQIAS
ncbi:hypothetical protein Desti_0330 [Desulfomonile tiedjei DSM 6799]|uniref:Uncharacterized protein n=1 Tax=Desulfomonile tiedjei (strain ATCC 49306 / DSM 6799 / DCB-1) TaxID=706587 RepID=I4C0H8_DESTA|nr:hypothetical protein Desti_0330 [Desulfomonile tiedjei DSM 6799]